MQIYQLGLCHFYTNMFEATSYVVFLKPFWPNCVLLTLWCKSYFTELADFAKALLAPIFWKSLIIFFNLVFGVAGNIVTCDIVPLIKSIRREDTKRLLRMQGLVAGLAQASQ